VSSWQEALTTEANRATEVIRRVRALAKKTDLEMVPLDINHVVREVVALVQRELTSHQASVRTELASALPMTPGDRVQLQQVIINLAMNGAEAIECAEATQSVTDRPRELMIRSSQDETQQVLVGVTDSGVGISAENADRLFNPFFQIQRHGHVTLDLPFDHGSPRWSAVGHGKPTPRSHVSVHPGGERRLWVVRLRP
jgi:C4-dicarboxylate-specific signal transduction histidine kinase